MIESSNRLTIQALICIMSLLLNTDEEKCDAETRELED